jgi:hypothetical protein
MTMKLSKATSKGLTLSGWWTWSKTMDTGSEATVTNTDVNAPVGSVNPQASLRALSSFNQTNRLVVSTSYDLPWMKNQNGVLGRIVGGWTISGVTTFASGLPFSVYSGFDQNLDGNGGDLPVLLDQSYLGTSVDRGRPLNPCPSTPTAVGRCLDTLSQTQLPSSVFAPSQADLKIGNKIPLNPGADTVPGAVRRNSFFQQGQKNVDAALNKSIRIRESMSLQLRMELYNVFNRTTFAMPDRTINATVPLSRIESTINLQNYVNSARATGARMGQFALRFTF